MQYLVIMLLFSVPVQVLATDQRSVLDNYALVGVISEGEGGKDGSGIAVIRDVALGQTLTLRIGQLVPNRGALRVKSIARQEVILSDGQAQVALRYSGSTPSTANDSIADEENSDEDFDFVRVWNSTNFGEPSPIEKIYSELAREEKARLGDRPYETGRRSYDALPYSLPIKPVERLVRFPELGEPNEGEELCEDCLGDESPTRTEGEVEFSDATDPYDESTEHGEELEGSWEVSEGEDYDYE